MIWSSNTATPRSTREDPGRQSSSAGRGPHHKKDISHLAGIDDTLNSIASSLKAPAKITNDGFTLVESKSKHRGKKADQADMQVSGLLLSCVGSKAELEWQLIPFGTMLQALILINPNVMVFPYNCAVDNIHKASSLLKHPQDYKALMDIILINWGSPSDSKGKLAFSFYIGSTITGKDLHAVKQSRQFQQFLNQSKLQLTTHYLHQTESKPLAFFSGKSPKHTWCQHLCERFQEYLNHYLKDPNA